MTRGYSLKEETILTRRRVRAGKDNDFCLKAVRNGKELAGTAEVVPYVDADLKHTAVKVVEKAKALCLSKSVWIYIDYLVPLFCFVI
ncbi:BnaC08g14800D [Brassica napus]|uniref:(rape) hypothetical protein n=1 Tax=Brassica napus TaxID=3708 RepID=A0A078ILK9_BRANA|nr:unnamed protein product [Brassica napus]CDY50224.1 BnaC08g14800D [Brassica napus]